MKIIKTLVIVAAATLTLASCNRFLDVTPTGQVIPQTQEDFRAMLTRAYALYPAHKALANLKSDEVKAANSSESLKAIFTWGETSETPGSTAMPYESLYQIIFHTNYILENAQKYASPSPELNQILGEAHALRAYIYFELVNLYAPIYNDANKQAPAVPLVLKVGLEGEFPRASLEAIHNQILADINSAKQLLNQAKFDVGHNYRFTTTSLAAFKARFHQYRGEWQEALVETEKVLAVNSELEDFNSFKILPSNFNSKESIMNLDLPVNSTANSFSRASDSHIALFDQTNDLRFAQYFKKDRSNTHWQTTKFDSNKFKVSFRVGEVMLIKAEAQFKLGKETDSKTTLFQLAEKRYNATGLASFKTKVNALSGEAYYTELLNERAREISFEGLRWFDLRRTTQPEITRIFGGANYVLQAKDPRYTIPFPKDARLRNPKL